MSRVKKFFRDFAPTKRLYLLLWRIKGRVRRILRLLFRKLWVFEVVFSRNLKELDGWTILKDDGDFLHPRARFLIERAAADGADFVYYDEAVFEKKPTRILRYLYKPDFAPDTLRGFNYIGKGAAFKKTLLDGDYSGYDLSFRLAERAEKITHIRGILYYRNIANIGQDSGGDIEAIRGHLSRKGLLGEVFEVSPFHYRVKYNIESPLISIIIPNRNSRGLLEQCVNSVLSKTTYTNFEIIIIENNSTEEDIFGYYKYLEESYKNIRVVVYEGKYNFSAVNNFGFRHTGGEYIIMLNNDTEVITPEWIEEMLMFAGRADVGAVGAKLLYPDGGIQHAGAIVSKVYVGNYAENNLDMYGDYMNRLAIAQNQSAVTSACLMTRREVWEKLGGMDEVFVASFSDPDFCVRTRENGYTVIFTPFATLYHYESKSRGYDDDDEKKAFSRKEFELFQSRHIGIIGDTDPYYCMCID